MVSWSASGKAHPPRSKPPLRSSSAAPGPCITPSTETCVVVVSFIVAPPAPSKCGSRERAVQRSDAERGQVALDGGRVAAGAAAADGAARERRSTESEESAQDEQPVGERSGGTVAVDVDQRDDAVDVGLDR